MKLRQKYFTKLATIKKFLWLKGGLNRPVLWLSLISVLIFISRWWGRSQYLYDSDSALYALALNNYDVSIQQPHPPGYPLYILVAKLVDWVVRDANLALIIVSIIFSVATIWVLFNLASRVYNPTVAWVSVLLFSSGAVGWFHGQVALSYMCDAFFVSWFALYAYEAWNNRLNTKALTWATIILALGGGFRLSWMLFMVPLWLWIVLSTWNWRIITRQIGLVVSIVTLWAIPMVYFSGGWLNYWHAFSALMLDKNGLYSFSIMSANGAQNLLNHLTWLTQNTMLQFGWSLVFIIVWLIHWLMPDERKKFDWVRLHFWLWLCLPAILFYIIIIYNLPGYTLILIPPLTIIVAKSIVAVMAEVLAASKPESSDESLNIGLIAVVVLLVTMNIWLYYKPDNQPSLQQSTQAAIKVDNLLWSSLLNKITDNFSPQNTIIALEGPFVSWGLPHFQYYFPSYPTYGRVTGGAYNPNNKKWFLAYQGRLNLVDSLNVYPTDTSMIIVRSSWRDRPAGYSVVSLGYNLGFIPYHNLTDPTIRPGLENIDGIIVESNNGQ